jgi:Zn-dependent M16 (insulinase) family peptidase
MQAYRDQILSATTEDIRSLEPLVRDALAQEHFCVVGNEDVLDASKEMFDVLEDLY